MSPRSCALRFPYVKLSFFFLHMTASFCLLLAFTLNLCRSRRSPASPSHPLTLREASVILGMITSGASRLPWEALAYYIPVQSVPYVSHKSSNSDLTCPTAFRISTSASTVRVSGRLVTGGAMRKAIPASFFYASKFDRAIITTVVELHHTS